MKKWTISALASILLVFPALTVLGDPPPEAGPSGLPVFQMPIGPGAESKNGVEKKDDDEAEMRAKNEKEPGTCRFQFVRGIPHSSATWRIITAKWLKYATKEIGSLRECTLPL